MMPQYVDTVRAANMQNKFNSGAAGYYLNYVDFQIAALAAPVTILAAAQAARPGVTFADGGGIGILLGRAFFGTAGVGAVASYVNRAATSYAVYSFVNNIVSISYPSHLITSVTNAAGVCQVQGWLIGLHAGD